MKENMFNTENILNETNLAIKNGLNIILKDYMERYNLLENTHKQIMLLPSVLNEIKHKECLHHEVDDPMFVSIKDTRYELLVKEIEQVDKKIENLEKNYDNIIPIFDKILEKIELLSCELTEIKKTQIKF